MEIRSDERANHDLLFLYYVDEVNWPLYMEIRSDERANLDLLFFY